LPEPKRFSRRGTPHVDFPIANLAALASGHTPDALFFIQPQSAADGLALPRSRNCNFHAAHKQHDKSFCLKQNFTYRNAQQASLQRRIVLPREMPSMARGCFYKLQAYVTAVRVDATDYGRAWLWKGKSECVTKSNNCRIR